MKYQELEKLVSVPRMNRYLLACSNSKTKAQKLYKANLRIAQSFYPILNLFEVFLRNVIHYELSTHFANADWIINEKRGFMNNTRLRRSGYYLKNQVMKAERKLRVNRIRVTSGRIIAEQPLGFWTSLFERHHYALLRGAIIHCFPNKPRHINRKAIHIRLQLIRDFRNRIYHNEPICFNGLNIDFQNAYDAKKEIYNLLSWINNEARNYVQMYDNVDNKILMGRRI